MTIEELQRILTAFADQPADIDLSRGTLLLQIRDEVIEARTSLRHGELNIEEDGQQSSATSWLINRIARLPLLADRILNFVAEPDHFVTPSGTLLDQPDFSDVEVPTNDAGAAALALLTRRPAGTSSVLYLTSDAGEGKTTLINQLARLQAQAYKAKKTDWLLVPIPLGGRAFLRFDDVVVAALVNRLRFQLFYFEAFIELVRLGVVVPAFDGFEEMFVETSSGEAASALGNLVRSLRSSGSVLIAARKAYFDYQSFQTQTRLFDAIGSDSVAFARIALRRWDREQFLQYANKRSIAQPEVTYDAVSKLLSPTHPLLTRAVLVRRLLDVASQSEDLTSLLRKVGNTPQDYFFQFVNALVEREAREKWIDRSGEAAQPLLSVSEHHDLLAMVSQEMWISSADHLRGDVLDVISEMFCETTKKSPLISRQVRERLKQHSLLTTAEGRRDSFAFDHEDFRTFYLGEALGRVLARDSLQDLRLLLQPSALPPNACDEAILRYRREGAPFDDPLARLQRLSDVEGAGSFIKENSGLLAIRLLEASRLRDVSLVNMTFPSDSLKARRLPNAQFQGCYFQPTSLEGADLSQSEFERCVFDRLEVDTQRLQATFRNCEIRTLVLQESDDHLFDPDTILAALVKKGAVVPQTAPAPAAIPASDEELRQFERVLRIFLRATAVNESVIRTRLGVNFGQFVNVLPALLRAEVFQEVPYLGSGNQRRFKLNVPMQILEEALKRSKGSFEAFLREVQALR